MAITHADLDYSDCLGKGSFGEVYKAMSKTDGRLCAAKFVSLPLNCPQHHQEKIWKRFCRECDILLHIQHPNIVQCLGIIQAPPVALLMEIMTTSLSSYLLSETPPLKCYTQVNLCHDIISALKYLHEHEIIHRDLSSNNILLKGQNETLMAKVGDFGMIKLISELDPSIQLTQNPGTVEYMPPEAFYFPAKYTEKIDIFSYGVLVLQILTCKFPIPSERRQDFKEPESVRRQNHIQLIHESHPLRHVALLCISDNDKDRPSANELVQHMESLKKSQMYVESCERNVKIEALQHEVHKLQQKVQRLKQTICFNRQNWRSIEGDRQISCRRSVDAVICGSNIYIRPSHDKGEILVFHLDSESWRDSLQHDYSCSTLASVNDNLIAIGGTRNRANESKCTEKVFCLHPIKEDWPQMQHARCRSTAITYKNKLLIVIGGEHPIGNSLDTVELMNTELRQWNYASSLPKTQYSCSSAIVNNNLYVLGGWTEREELLSVAFKCNTDLLINSCHHSLNLEPSIWETITANPPVAQTTCVSYNGALLTIGGTWCKCYECKCGEPTKNIYMYSEDIDEWDCVGSTPVAHYLCLSCVLSNKQLIIIGGAVSKDEALTDIYVNDAM